MLQLPSLLALASFVLLGPAAPALALDAAGWRSQQIYQVITDRFARPSNVTATCSVNDRAYCGGTHAALVDRLDYIQDMGFTAVWISPVVSNIGGSTAIGEAYHGYWTLDLSKLNTNFGDAADLTALADALHARGMYLMVDIVVNHVAATSSSTFATSSSYGPFDEQSDFHSFCWIDAAYTNQTNIEQCWLGDTNVALPDIDTEDDTVVSYFNTWVKQFVSDYSIDGLRIDTVKHVRKDFWPDFTAASGVYTVGEVLEGSVDYCAPYTEVMDGVLNYPAYYPLGRAFQATNGSIAELAAMHDTLKAGVKDTTLLGNFLENHDQVRYPSYVSDEILIANAMAYPFLTDGIPILYYGQEQGFSGGADPANREPMWESDYSTTSDGYILVQNLTAVRSAAGNASADFYTTQSSVAGFTEHELVISKPPLVSVLSNRGTGGSGTVKIASNASLPASASVVDVLTCTSWATGSDGGSTVAITNGMPVLILPESDIGSLCPGGVTASTTNTASTDSSSGGGSSGSGGGDSAASTVLARSASPVVALLALAGVQAFL